MNNQLEFIIPPLAQKSNSCSLLDCTLASLWVPKTLKGTVLLLLGSFDGISYVPLDYRIDLTVAANKGVIITQLQNYCCGLRAIKLSVDMMPVPSTQTLYGGVLC